MDPIITVALISAGASIIVGALTLVGVLVSNSKSNKSIQAKLEKNQAVSDTKLEELTREVRAHNDFASRIPVLESQIKELRRDYEALSDRVNRYHMPN